MNALLIRHLLGQHVLEDVRYRSVAAVALGIAFLGLSQSYVYFDAYWSIIANAVIFVGAVGVAFYGLTSFAK